MSQLKGIFIQTKDATPNRPLWGLYGVALAVNAFAFAKLVNKRGTGMAGASIQIPDGRIFNSDSKGNVALPNMTNPSTLIIRKDMVRLEYVWTGATQFTVMIEPPPVPI